MVSIRSKFQVPSWPLGHLKEYFLCKVYFLKLTQIRCKKRFMGLKEFRWTKVIQFVNHMIPLLMWNNWHWFLWTYIIKDGRFLFKKDFHCNWTSFINASNSSLLWKQRRGNQCQTLWVKFETPIVKFSNCMNNLDVLRKTVKLYPAMKISHQNFSSKCLVKMSNRNVPSKCLIKMSHKNVSSKCLIKLSHLNGSSKWLIKMSR